MGAIKGIPYGMSNFTNIKEQNCYYVDKTMYLPLLEEQAHYLILVRPRRFGKSLFLDMLRSYYDLSQKDKFESQAAQQWAAVEQIHGYAEGTHVRQLCQRTQLHCIVMQFCGWELARIEEV